LDPIRFEIVAMDTVSPIQQVTKGLLEQAENLLEPPIMA
jgi:hypothetical protein